MKKKVKRKMWLASKKWRKWPSFRFPVLRLAAILVLAIVGCSWCGNDNGRLKQCALSIWNENHIIVFTRSLCFVLGFTPSGSNGYISYPDPTVTGYFRIIVDSLFYGGFFVTNIVNKYIFRKNKKFKTHVLIFLIFNLTRFNF